ncbi:hypothetical protein CFP56_021480 [Quercus suber]|uniref:CCHC-type domain-containing protein n=1 Tax=Quercus suber TaxID=58331 RepID=A0AAW0KDW5_QUESU
MDKLLWHHVTIGSFTQAIQYENLLTLCFLCGRIGHTMEHCPVRLPSTLTHLPLQTFLPVTMMDHLPYLPHSLDFDLPPSSPFHHPQNSSSNTLNPDAQPFYSLALVDYLTFHMSLIHPPNSPQPIQILQVALHPTTPIQ